MEKQECRCYCHEIAKQELKFVHVDHKYCAYYVPLPYPKDEIKEPTFVEQSLEEFNKRFACGMGSGEYTSESVKEFLSEKLEEAIDIGEGKGLQEVELMKQESREKIVYENILENSRRENLMYQAGIRSERNRIIEKIKSMLKENRTWKIDHYKNSEGYSCQSARWIYNDEHNSALKTVIGSLKEVDYSELDQALKEESI